MPDYQQQVARFIDENSLETIISFRLLDLVSEVGELAKEVLKGSDYGKSKFEIPETWESELGDVFFSLIYIANGTGVDMAKALQSALVKYSKRLSHAGDAGSGKLSKSVPGT